MTGTQWLARGLERIRPEIEPTMSADKHEGTSETDWKQRYESLAETHARVLRERGEARRERDEARSALREIYAEAKGFLDTWDPLR